MPYKFKVGDRLKVMRMKDSNYARGVEAVGKTGEVVEIIYRLYRIRIPGVGEILCDVDELEAAPAKKTRKKRGK